MRMSSASSKISSLVPEGQGGEAASALTSALPRIIASGAEGAALTKAELAAQARAARHAAYQAAREQKTLLRDRTRTRKSAETRERILRAATDLIAETGGIDFQMSDVAERCDMSKGSLYYYFTDRDAIVEEIFGRGIDELVASLEEVVTHARSAHEALQGLCDEFGRRAQAGGTVVLAMAVELLQGGSRMLPMVETRFQGLAKLVETQLERAKGEGVVREDVDPALAASCICGTFLFAAIRQMARGGEEVDMKDFSDQLMEFVIRGVGVDTGGAVVTENGR